MKRKKAIWLFILLALILVLFFLKNVNPYESQFYLKCPFKTLTGFLCAGCGSQRAMHFLLNLEFLQAYNENALLVLSIPYLMLGITFESMKHPSPRLLRWRNMLFGIYAIYVVLAVIVLFWIFRNVFY